eukprot:SAG25_NODE_1329_length_3279_cov_494.218553_3_plen_157_part_00
MLAIDECLSAVLPTARHSHPFWARQRVAVLQQELTGCERERSRLSAQASATQQRVMELASERAEWAGRTSAAEKKVAELSEELCRARRPGEIDLTGAGGRGSSAAAGAAGGAREEATAPPPRHNHHDQNSGLTETLPTFCGTDPDTDEAEQVSAAA